MGWCNYIIIPQWKVAIECSRYAHHITYDQIDALDYLHYHNDIPVEEIAQKPISEITIEEANGLYTAINTMNVFGFDVDIHLLYWLKAHNIEYDIIDEFGKEKSKYKEQGYTFLSMCSKDIDI